VTQIRARSDVSAHARNFDVRDWTHYNDRNPLKSHEVAQFKYTKHLKYGCGSFRAHVV